MLQMGACVGFHGEWARPHTDDAQASFPEGILRGTQYGNHPRTKYALKIHSIIEELMNKDWCKVNNNIK